MAKCSFCLPNGYTNDDEYGNDCACPEGPCCGKCAESAYYFDWHAQIDNPVSVLKGAIAHLQRGRDWNETAVNALRDALSIVVDEWYK